MIKLSKIDKCLVQANRKAIAHVARHKFRYHLFALSLFLIGGMWSVLQFRVNSDALELKWLLLNLLLASPIAIGLNALGLLIVARLTKIKIGFLRALDISSFATVSNLLPIPAGTVIQTSLLGRESESLTRPLRFILLGHICSIAVMGLACGFAILFRFQIPGFILILTSSILIVICTALVHYAGNVISAISFLLLRITRGAMMIFRVYISFLALDKALSPGEAAIFSVASEVGSLLVIFPTGLGASEMIAAFLAAILGESISIAFLAMALNRLAGIAAAGFIAVLFVLSKPRWRRIVRKRDTKHI